MSAPVSKTNFADDMTVIPLSPKIGVVVSGIDLAEPPSENILAIINDLLIHHKVLFFKNQTLTPNAQRRFAELFGPLHIHPIDPSFPAYPEIMITEHDLTRPPDGNIWHTDVTFIETPPLGAILYAVEVPPVGGDTMWANMATAYEALSNTMKTFVDGLHASHDFAKSFGYEKFSTTEDQNRWQRIRADYPPVVHPVVRTHPISGQKSLFVNSAFTTHIIELKSAESDEVLQFLFKHTVQPEFTLRYRWQKNDVAFWDNRITQHYALADYLPHYRCMHRATIIGDRPI